MANEVVQFRQGLFGTDGGRVYLWGTRCMKCGYLYFPPRSFCLECSGTMEKIKLQAEGVLYSYTIIYMPSLHFLPPYTAGWIDLYEGVRIFAPLLFDMNEKPEIGIKMEAVTGELWQEDKISVVGYYFRPSRVKASSQTLKGSAA